MKAADYMINPVLMGGLVKEVHGDTVKIHLHGRLGVITVPRRVIRGEVDPEPGHEMQFWFSYLWSSDVLLDYDTTPMTAAEDTDPCLLGGTLTEVNDTAVVLTLVDGLGTIAVPRRWLFTDVTPEPGLVCEGYLSGMRIVGRREIPVEQI